MVEKLNNKEHKLTEIYLSKLFISVLVLKIIFSFFFSSHYLTQYFTPFIKWFVQSGFKNPWDYFYSLNELKMFPYPTVMLWIMTFPVIIFNKLMSTDWKIISGVDLFVMRIPLLVFDIFMFNLFLKIFPTKKEMVLYTYWCSPIIFFINYIHGQLDLIPTAIFLYTIVLLLSRKYYISIIFLAIAAATKTHIFIFMPFIFLFLYKQRVGVLKLTLYFLSFLILYLLFISPYISSKAFVQMVFKAVEQQRIYQFSLPVSNTLSIVVCPIVIFLLFMKFASYKKLNKEILIMFAGIIFACLIIFVTPMPGWFVWSLPFLIYFYINNVDHSRAPFILYNLIYAIYFTFFFEKNYSYLSNFIDPVLFHNLAVSLLLSSVGFSAIWMYQSGVKRNEELKIKEKPLLIGIGGDSGSGKHTAYGILENLLGKDLCVPVFGDNFHKWERGDENWKVYTHLDPTSNKLHQEVESAVALKEGREIEIVHYDHNIGRFTNPHTVEPNKFVFFIGLHPFYLKIMRELIDIKIFMDPDERLRQFWKVERDVTKRGYEKEKVVEQIISRTKDSEKYIKPQKEFADLIIRYIPVSDIDINNLKRSAIPIKVRYELDNSINLEGLFSGLSKIKTLEVAHKHSDNLIHQELEINGSVSGKEIASLAFDLGLNFDELLVSSPGWLSDYDGITQLVFLLIYNNKMKAKRI
jgi:uridine kinase